jgi:hypothetical protein
LSVDQNIEDLQAVSDHVLATTDQLRKLELEKREVDPGSKRFLELAKRIESLAAEVRVVSASETDLASELNGESNLPTINEAEATS